MLTGRLRTLKISWNWLLSMMVEIIFMVERYFYVITMWLWLLRRKVPART